MVKYPNAALDERDVRLFAEALENAAGTKGLPSIAEVAVSRARRCIEHFRRKAVRVSRRSFASSMAFTFAFAPYCPHHALSPSAQHQPEFPLRLLVMYNAPEQNQESGKKREDGPAPC